jgi:hypothetical protein
MGAKTVITLILAVDDEPNHVADMLIERPGPNGRDMLRNLSKRLAAYATGIKLSKFRLRVDTSTEGATYDLIESGRVVITITFANITAGETIVIGTKTLTWAVAAANENEVTIGADLAAAKANLIAAINANSGLEGIFFASASDVAAEVYLDCLLDSRAASLMTISETGDAVALSATNFDGDTTDALVAASDTELLGLP